jgi:hypothetical protein
MHLQIDVVVVEFPKNVLPFSLMTPKVTLAIWVVVLCEAVKVLYSDHSSATVMGSQANTP